MRFLGDVHRMLVIRQDGNGEGIAQGEDGVGCSAVAAEIVDDDREPRVRNSSGGVLRSYDGLGVLRASRFLFRVPARLNVET